MLLLCGATPAGSGKLWLSQVEATGCGTLRAEVHVRPKRRARELLVMLDGGVADTVVVPAAASLVPVEVPVGADRVVHLSVSLDRLMTAPIPTVVPAWDVALAVSLPAQAPVDELPKLSVRVLTPCPVEGLGVSAQLGERAVLHKEPLTASRQVEVPVEGLSVGAHPVRVSLWARGEQLSELTQGFLVTPPCVDEDGDGVDTCAGDCEDHDPAIHPGAKERFGDEVDSDCDGVDGYDRDGDGLASTASGGTDCDDTDPSIPREEASQPTGVDEDCDGLIDEGTVAFDDDGDGLSEDEGDCNDDDDRVRPGIKEAPDCRDNNCDGEIDEGVTRPEVDDRYEPNDVEAFELPGATKRKTFFGFGTGYRTTSSKIQAITRDGSDAERFTVWAHDSATDNFHVAVTVLTLGDERSYQVRIHGGERSTSAVLDGPGQSLRLGDITAVDDTGVYTIEVSPLAGERRYCPVELLITGG